MTKTEGRRKKGSEKKKRRPHGITARGGEAQTRRSPRSIIRHPVLQRLKLAEGTLFPGTERFLADGRDRVRHVKLPRVPVAQNIPGDEMPMSVILGEHPWDMPRKGRGKAEVLDPRAADAYKPRWRGALRSLRKHLQAGGRRHSGPALLHCSVQQHLNLQVGIPHLRLSPANDDVLPRSKTASCAVPTSTNTATPSRGLIHCWIVANNLESGEGLTTISATWQRTKSNAFAVTSSSAVCRSPICKAQGADDVTLYAK